MVVYLLMWLALSAVAALAYVFGSSVGYRRGFEEAMALRSERAGSSVPAPDVSRVVRLPEDVSSAT